MKIVGHQRAQSYLTRILAHNDAHTYVFCGSAYVGKYLIAQQFATALVNGANQLQDSVVHADIITIAPQVIHTKNGTIKVKDIGVEEIRKAVVDLARSPLMGVRRVLVVDNADRMTIRAQNALLKILEEPPSNSAIILVTAYEGRLLSTIMSRVRRVTFGILSQAELLPIVQELFDNESDREIILRIAMGRPGIIYQCAQDAELFAQYRQDVAQWEKITTMTIYDKIEYAQQLSQDVVHVRQILQLWIALWHTEMRKVSTCANCVSCITSATNLLALLETTNVNVRLAIEDFLLQI